MITLEFFVRRKLKIVYVFSWRKNDYVHAKIITFSSFFFIFSPHLSREIVPQWIWTYGWNPKVWQCKWNPLSTTFIWPFLLPFKLAPSLIFILFYWQNPKVCAFKLRMDTFRMRLRTCFSQLQHIDPVTKQVWKVVVYFWQWISLTLPRGLVADLITCLQFN